MSLESWKTLFEIVGVILLGLTFIDGGLIWFFGKRANEQQAEELDHLRLETAKANERTAEIQIELELEKQRRSPRQLSDEQKKILVDELRGKIQHVTFVVQRDLEARWFMFQLAKIFQDAGAATARYDMPPGEIMSAPGVVMYRPGGATSERVLKTDPVYIALTKSKLFGGTAAKPFSSVDVLGGSVAPSPLLPADAATGYVLYIGQKPQ